MSKQILLVDDEEHMLHLLRFALKDVPAYLRCVKCGSEALSLLERESVDLVLLDYSMPGLDGVETLRRIRALERGERIRVIMLTSRDQTSIRREAEGLRVDAFLTKPFSPRDLALRVSEVLA